MILDSLRHWTRYLSLGSGIRSALEYLHGSDFDRLDNGRYNLDGDQVYAIVNRYQTKPLTDAVWEAHRKYIDVQFVVRGTERLGYIPLDRAPEIVTPYDFQRDVTLYAPGDDMLRFSAGQFAILYPDDIHAPGLACDLQTPSEVLKVVVKVAVG